MDRPQFTTAQVQVMLAAVLMFATGATFSLGVFTVPIEQSALKDHAFDSVWPLGMGLMHFLSAPVMLIAGLVLDNATTQSIRSLSFTSACAASMLALAAPGIKLTSPSLIATAAAVQAVPLGVYYLLATEMLIVWMPDRTGLAVGVGNTAFGLGSIFSAWVFDRLLDMMNVQYAMVCTAGAVACIMGISSPLLVWPESSEKEEGYDEEEISLLNGISARKLGWRRLVKLPSFWLYIMAVLTAGASYAFIPYFFKLGLQFGVGRRPLLILFQLASALCVAFGMGVSMCTEHFRGTGVLSSGARNVMAGLLVVQTILFGVVLWSTTTGRFIPFVAAVTALKMIMSSHAGCAALLAHDMFGKVNSAIVYGFGAGVALGGGEGISAATMAAVEQWHASHVEGPAGYTIFYALAAVWSAVGLVSAMLIYKSDDIFTPLHAVRISGVTRIDRGTYIIPV